MEPAALDRFIDHAAARAAQGEVPAPESLQLLLRQYLRTGQDALRDAVAAGLSTALVLRAEGRLAADAPSWIFAFVDATAVSDDERLADALAAEVETLRARWPWRGDIGPSMRGIEACLAAGALRLAHPRMRDLGAAAVDELEREVGATYRPGEGVARRVDQPDGPLGTLDDHVAAASALLTAWALTARLPYAMLAEELMAAARHQWWDALPGRFGTEADGFHVNCLAARVLARLAALDEDPAYREIVSPPPGTTYDPDARRLLETLALDAAAHDARMVSLAVVLIEWEARISAQTPAEPS